jgi:hypothetical protein
VATYGGLKCQITQGSVRTRDTYDPTAPAGFNNAGLPCFSFPSWASYGVINKKTDLLHALSWLRNTPYEEIYHTYQWFNASDFTFFFLKYAKNLRIFIIKVEMFGTNNALLALEGLRDFNRELDHLVQRFHFYMAQSYNSAL